MREKFKIWRWIWEFEGKKLFLFIWPKTCLSVSGYWTTGKVATFKWAQCSTMNLTTDFRWKRGYLRYLLPGNHTEKISEGAVLWEFSKVLSWVDYASIIVPNWCVMYSMLLAKSGHFNEFPWWLFFYHYNPGYTVVLSL